MESDHNRHLGNRMIILSNQVKHYLHHAAQEEGISGSQSRILHYLAANTQQEEVYQKDVEDFFCLRRSTVTQTLQTMEKNGLICRHSVERDARLKRLELTEEGRSLDARIHAKVEVMEQQLSACMTKEEKEQFLYLTEKLSREMENLGSPYIEAQKQRE